MVSKKLNSYEVFIRQKKNYLRYMYIKIISLHAASQGISWQQAAQGLGIFSIRKNVDASNPNARFYIKKDDIENLKDMCVKYHKLAGNRVVMRKILQVYIKYMTEYDMENDIPPLGIDVLSI